MNPLPLPVRIAAGLVVTAVEQVQELPRLVVEFPVTAVSQALQASMRVQQKITELAIKGDRALGTLRPVEEKPSWATFDEDEPPRRNGVSAVTELRPARTVTPVDVTREEAAAPTALPGYAELTIPQLRAKLRTLTVEDLRELLAWEQAHENRPPFVTMLGNRITTVTEG